MIHDVGWELCAARSTGYSRVADARTAILCWSEERAKTDEIEKRIKEARESNAGKGPSRSSAGSLLTHACAQLTGSVRMTDVAMSFEIGFGDENKGGICS